MDTRNGEFKHTERRITRRKTKTEERIKANARNIARQMDIGRGRRRAERNGVQVGQSRETYGNNSARND